ncbi:MAG: PaREP1 family protein [bacterium]
MKATKDNKVNRYIAQAERYLQQGEKELEAGDLRQAGEKYWGGATQILKAWATAKGIQHITVMPGYLRRQIGLLKKRKNLFKEKSLVWQVCCTQIFAKDGLTKER